MRRVNFKYEIVSVLLIIIWGCGDTFDKYDAYADYLSIRGLYDGNMLLFNESDSLKSFFIDSDKDGVIEYLNNNDMNWLKIDTLFKKRGDTISVSVSKFKKYPKEKRKADLRINVGDYSRQITISQESLDIYITVSTHEITLEAKEDNITDSLHIDCNTNWTSSYKRWGTDNNENFYMIVPISGNNEVGNAVFRRLQTNISKSVLRDTVLFYPENHPELAEPVDIILPPKPNLEIGVPGQKPNEIIDFNSHGDSIEIKVICNKEWNRPQKLDWLSFKYREDDKDSTITYMTIIAGANDTDANKTPEERKKTIVIECDKPYDYLSESIIISQEPLIHQK